MLPTQAVHQPDRHCLPATSQGFLLPGAGFARIEIDLVVDNEPSLAR